MNVFFYRNKFDFSAIAYQDPYIAMIKSNRLQKPQLNRYGISMVLEDDQPDDFSVGTADFSPMIEALSQAAFNQKIIEDLSRQKIKLLDSDEEIFSKEQGLSSMADESTMSKSDYCFYNVRIC